MLYIIFTLEILWEFLKNFTRIEIDVGFLEILEIENRSFNYHAGGIIRSFSKHVTALKYKAIWI